MSDSLKLFEISEFSKVRVVYQDGEPWFIASDVAKVLGYERPNDAVKAHCKKINKFRYSDSATQAMPYNIIPESDVYLLIMRSHLPNAVRFQKQLCEDVLPSIRKHGAYFTPKKLEELLSDPDTVLRFVTDLKAEQEKRRQLAEKVETNSDYVRTIYYDSDQI